MSLKSEMHLFVNTNPKYYGVEHIYEEKDLNANFRL